MEPVFRPFCPRFRTLPTFVTLSLRNFKASARCISLKPQIAGFGSQRMFPSCGLITSRSREFCLECGKSFPAVYLWRKDATEQKCIVIRIVFALLILYAIMGLIGKTLSAPSVGARWRYKSGIKVRDQPGISGLEATTFRQHTKT